MPVLINNDSGLAENLPDQDASSAMTAGSHSVPVVNKQTGDLESMSTADASTAVSSGTHAQPGPDQLKSLMKTAKFSSTGEQIKAGLEGAAEGVAGPLAPLAEKALGVKGEDIVARQEANPITHDVGVGVGLVGSTVADFGLGAVLNTAGAAAKVGLGLEKGALLFGSEAAAKIAGAAAAGGVENALFQTQDELAKYINGNPSGSVGLAAMNVGMAGLLGVGIGGALGTVPAAWDALSEGRVGKFVGDFTGQIEQMRNITDPVSHLTNELNGKFQSIEDMNSDLWGKSGLKAQNIDKLAPELNDTIRNAAQETINDMKASVEKMTKKSAMYGERYPALLQENIEQYETAVQNAKSTADIFNATNDLKKQLNKHVPDFYTPDNVNASAFGEFNSVTHQIKESLENNKIWGKLGDFQAETNKAASEFYPANKDFKRKFTSELLGDKKVNPANISTYLKQLGDPKAEFKQEALKNWLEAADKFKQKIDQAHANLGIENPHAWAETPMAFNTLGEQTAGAQAANWVLHKGVGAAVGGAIGAGIGAKFAAPTLGGLIGAKTLSGPINKAFNSIILPLLQKSESSGSGAKAALDFAVAAIKGESKLDNLTSDVFRAGRSIISADIVKRDKLKDKLAELQEKPGELVDNDKDHLGHYLPDHSVALAQQKMQAGQYLQTLKPNNTPLGPLDAKQRTSKEAETRYNNALDIANNPGLVLQKLKNGTVTLNDIKDLQGTNPALLSRMQSKLMEHIIDAQHNKQLIPYKIQQSLSLFMAQPLSSSMQPMAIQANQMSPSIQQPQPNAQMSTPGRHNYTGLQKMPNMYQTPQQARQAYRLK